jgi:hypothetical protein
VNREGQSYKVAFTTYLVVEKLDPSQKPYIPDGHRIISLNSGKTLEVSEAYLADLEEKGKRLT